MGKQATAKGKPKAKAKGQPKAEPLAKRAKTKEEEPVVDVPDKDEAIVDRGACSRFITAMNYTIYKSINPDAKKLAESHAALEDPPPNPIQTLPKSLNHNP